MSKTEWQNFYIEYVQNALLLESLKVSQPESSMSLWLT